MVIGDVEGDDAVRQSDGTRYSLDRLARQQMERDRIGAERIEDDDVVPVGIDAAATGARRR